MRPQLEWRRQGAAWFFAARGAVHARQYDITDPGLGKRSDNVVVPIASVDGGLHPNFFGWKSQQEEAELPFFGGKLGGDTFGVFRTRPAASPW